MLGLGSDAEAIEDGLESADFIGIGFAEGACCPVVSVLVGFLGSPAVDVPGQVHAELQLLFGRLDVAHVDNPLVADALVVCLAELVAAERGRDGAEPQIGVGRAPVGEVIVYGVAARARLLGGRRHLPDVAMIVVHPHQRHVVGHLQTGVVAVEHLFVGDEYLRDGGGVADAVGQELPLVGDDVGEGCHAFGRGAVAVDACIVDATHAEGVDGILAATLAHALGPVALNHLLVRLPHPVRVAVTAELVARLAPLVLIVPEHLLAMAGAHVDVVLHDEGDVRFLEPEGTAAGVHRGPEGVGPQAQQQLHDGGVGLGAEVVQRCIHLLCCPGAQAEVLVVEEDAAELHRG